MEMNLNKLQEMLEDEETGVLQSTNLQRVGLDLATEQQQQLTNKKCPNSTHSTIKHKSLAPFFFHSASVSKIVLGWRCTWEIFQLNDLPALSPLRTPWPSKCISDVSQEANDLHNTFFPRPQSQTLTYSSTHFTLPSSRKFSLCTLLEESLQVPSDKLGLLSTLGVRCVLWNGSVLLMLSTTQSCFCNFPSFLLSWAQHLCAVGRGTAQAQMEWERREISLGLKTHSAICSSLSFQILSASPATGWRRVTKMERL